MARKTQSRPQWLTNATKKIETTKLGRWVFKRLTNWVNISRDFAQAYLVLSKPHS